MKVKSVKILKHLFYYVSAFVALCLIVLALSYFANSNNNQELNIKESQNATHSIVASTNLDNQVALSSNVAKAGELVNASVVDPKYGFSISEVNFVDEHNQSVDNINYSINGNIVSFEMPDKSVKALFTYSTKASNEYNAIKRYDGKMTWKEGNTCDVYANWGMDLLTKGNNKEYNQELSVISDLFSGAAYYNAGSQAASKGAKVVWNNLPSTPRPDYDIYTNLGFRDVEYKSFRSSDAYEADDVTDAYFAYCPVLTDNNEVVNCYVCTVRGTNGTLSEWSSNFDVGADTNNYWARNASHWVNKTNHKGFDVTSELVLSYLKTYISNHKEVNANSTMKNYILFTGHSRGAAIANVLGAKVIDQIVQGTSFSNFTPFTYTFAPPKTTTSVDANNSKYSSIWNIINGDDTVPTLPYSSWGFKLYGNTKTYTVSTDDDLENKAESLAGWIDYWDPVDSLFGDMESLAKEMTKTREGLYAYPSEDEQFEGRACNYQLNWNSYEENVAALRAAGYDKFCKTAEKGFLFNYTYVMPSPAFCMYYLAHLASDSGYIASCPYQVEIDGTYNEYRILFVADGVFSMQDPHEFLTYYSMVRYRNF